MNPNVAALYVMEDGPYSHLSGVDAWGITRDARRYDGPNPVVAHPPCERWGRYATGGPNPKAARRQVGDDGGCFGAALRSVRSFRGVLEHPQGSIAWERYGLPLPPTEGGWSKPDGYGGRSCYIDQGAYGHKAKKPTWLYAVLASYPELDWSRVAGAYRTEESFTDKDQARKARQDPAWKATPRLSKRERTATPEPFRDALLSMVRRHATGPILVQASINEAVCSVCHGQGCDYCDARR